MENEQQRLIVAFILIIIILLFWSFVTSPRGSNVEMQKAKAKDSLKETVSNTTDELSAGDTILIESDNYRLTFTTKGGGIKSLYIKRYEAELVPERCLLFDTKIGDIKTFFEYSLLGDSLIFWTYVRGKKYEKVYYFHEDGFVLKVNFPDTIHHILSLKAGLKITEEKNQRDDLKYFNVYVQDKKFRSIVGEIQNQYRLSSDWKWIALRTKYFVLIVNNLANAGPADFYRLTKLNSEIYSAFVSCAAGGNVNRYGIEVLANSSFCVSVLVLPIKFSILAKYQKGYEQIEHGGIWGPIARLIILILNVFYSFVKNYGWAIVIFAFLLKIIFFPLSRQMIISQRRMQLLQPELKKLQEKFKNDPQALNREMMHLYKVYRVNPFSGCLPLLIQFPIFIALYQVLTTAIEFRRAPFILWISDLSIKDPYYVLPIAMGVLMLLQSLITTVDPRQRFMVIMMPLIMIIIFLNFPSGLQLYWFGYNLLSLLENFLIKRKVLG